MIIDLILDRRDGANKVVRDGKLYTTNEYTAKNFYNEVSEYGDIGHDIASAMDGGINEDVQKALCDYIEENEYNMEICTFINSVRWI